MHLDPVWRCYPNGTGVAAIALDPEEAKAVLDRGWVMLDGDRWSVSLAGWGWEIARDGRVGVRLTQLEGVGQPHAWEHP